MKKIFFLFLIAIVVFGCGKNDKKIVNSGSGKQTAVTNTTNGSQSNVAGLKKKRNFKGIVSPFTTKSPFEGTWVAELRDASNVFAYVILVKKAYDDDYTKKYIEVYSQTNKYEGTYNRISQTAVYRWKTKNNGRDLRWEIHDNDENSNFYRVNSNRRNETWTYNAVNDTIQISYIGFRNSTQVITYIRFSDAELQRIKQNAKNNIVNLGAGSNSKLEFL